MRLRDGHSSTNPIPAMNPVLARLAARAEAYPYSSAAGGMRLDAVPQGLKPCSVGETSVAAL